MKQVVSSSGCWCEFAYSCLKYGGKIKGMNWTTVQLTWPSLFFVFFFAACLKHGISGRTAVIKFNTTADMNTSVELSYPEEGLLGNSTWAYSYYHQNYTVSPPLLSDKTSTSKPKACEQLHIALEVWKACMPLNTKKQPFLKKREEKKGVLKLFTIILFIATSN